MTLDLPRNARLYLRPVQFADSPIERDGEVARLAGGLVWFSAWELIAVENGRRILQRTIPIADLPDDERLHAIAARITAPRVPLTLGERVLRFDQPQVMGILNLTPDSFSDGGKHSDDPEAAAGVGMAAEGATLIDVGGESTRPGSPVVSAEEEWRRIEGFLREAVRWNVPLSVDTYKPGIMRQALDLGVDIVNDVWALQQAGESSGT